jgi:hypothetical protein
MSRKQGPRRFPMGMRPPAIAAGHRQPANSAPLLVAEVVVA